MGNVSITALIIFFFLGITNVGFSQDEITDLKYEINKVYAPLSLSRETLNNAKTIYDLNPYFKESWVRRCLEIEIVTINNGDLVRIFNNDVKLSSEQKENLCTSDHGRDIRVNIKYIPENNLKNKEEREDGFTFVVNPEKDASYIGGKVKLMNYISKNGIEKIPHGAVTGYNMGVVKFSVGDDGKIINIDFHISSGDETADSAILDVIKEMPDWNPATYADGTKVQQDYVLMVGNLHNCNIPLLGIRSLPQE